MDLPISADPLTTELTGPEMLPVVQGGVNKRTNLSQLFGMYPVNFIPVNYGEGPAKPLVDHLLEIDAAFAVIDGGDF